MEKTEKRTRYRHFKVWRYEIWNFQLCWLTSKFRPFGDSWIILQIYYIFICKRTTWINVIASGLCLGKKCLFLRALLFFSSSVVYFKYLLNPGLTVLLYTITTTIYSLLLTMIDCCCTIQFFVRFVVIFTTIFTTALWNLKMKKKTSMYFVEKTTLNIQDIIHCAKHEHLLLNLQT